VNRTARLVFLICIAIPVSGCMTVDMGQADRPWWHTTINRDAVPWPLPTGDLEMLDYHNAHGAGWWDSPWVFSEQLMLLPSYLTYAIGETTYTEILGGGYEYGRDEWQWWAVNGTLGPPHAVMSSVNYGLVWIVDTVAHDPVAALIWMMREG